MNPTSKRSNFEPLKRINSTAASTRQPPHPGYTLMELLCVIGIIGILAGLYLGVIARAFIYVTKFVNKFSGH